MDAIAQRLGPGEWVDEVEFDAVLVASELVTNAIDAGCTQLSIGVHVHRTRVRLSVFDDAPGLPRLVLSGPSVARGRGIAVVAAVSRGWGVEVGSSGKDVWADLVLPEGAFGGRSLAWCYE